MKRLILCLAVGVLSCSSYADDLAGLLAKPLSPGSVALLVVHASEPRVRERWSAALKDPRAEVRAATARAINVSGTAALLEDLKSALLAEQDAGAGAEERRALAAIGLNAMQGDEALRAAAQRFGWIAADFALSNQVALPESQPGGGLRTAGGFPARFVHSLLAETGCNPASAHGFAGGEVSFGKDGRPRTVSLMVPAPGEKPFGGPPSCLEFAKALLYSSITHPGPADAKETILVMLSSDCLECLAEDLPVEVRRVDGVSGERPEKGHIEPPKALKKVRPEYPRAAGEWGVKGVVVLDAVITPTGCVRTVRVLQGLASLNLAAMQAVSQWRYSPALLDGKAVPVLMTVTVNFTLH